MPADISVLEWSIRLALAALLSGLIGFERETRHKAAGLRTHMLVGLGAALFTLVGAYAFGGDDPARVPAQIVTGVGFLGAGAIFREGATVRGLTTAAGLWAVAAIGMTAGSGLLLGSFIATGIALVILYGLGIIEGTLRSRRAAANTRPVGITLSHLKELSEIVTMACALDLSATGVDVEKSVDGEFVVHINVDSEKVDTVIAGVSTFESVVQALEMDPD